MKTTIDKPCEICGTVFQVEPYRLKHGRGRTCSQKCGYILRGKTQQTRITVACQRCGKPFEAIPSRLERGQDKYCSHECYAPHANGICLNCGKAFRYPPSANKQYCSRKCANTSTIRNQHLSDGIKQAWRDETVRTHMMMGIAKRSLSPNWYNAPHFQKGAAHPRYNGNKVKRLGAGRYEYKKWRKDVMHRDNFTCQICHKCGGKLQAHHIEHWATHPDLRYELSNGMTVCVPCHKALHSR